MKKLFRVSIALVMMLSAGSVYAVTTYTQFGRYLSVTNAPNSSDPYGIDGTVSREFPSYISNVGQAIQYTLQNTGYQLLSAKQSPESVQRLYQKSLPLYLRSIGPMPLDQALLTLSGHTFQLVVDPVNRLVSYKLRNEYQGL